MNSDVTPSRPVVTPATYLPGVFNRIRWLHFGNIELSMWLVVCLTFVNSTTKP